MQRIDSPPQITIHDLLPGDIFVFNFYGVPHAGIYAPTPGRQGDIIHMYFDKDRTGAIKSTLSKLLLSGHDVYMFRSKKLSGTAIAEQAEFWLNQGIEYDKPRLAQSLYAPTDENTSEDYNILKYLLIAARRTTMPIKTHQFPCKASSTMTNIGITMLLPDFTYFRPQLYLGAKLAMYDAYNPDRPKGMTCIMFVLSCLAAVALKDEIPAISKETGWISLKHAEDNHGVLNLLSEEELANFDVERIRHKLTPAIATLDPHKPSPQAFFDILRDDEDNWQFVGCLDKSIVKAFDKDAYRREQIELAANIKVNREKFIHTYGEGIFNRDPSRPPRHFTLFNEPQKADDATCQNNNALLM